MVETGIEPIIEGIEIRYQEKVDRFYQEMQGKPEYAKGYLDGVGLIARFLSPISGSSKAAKINVARRVIEESKLVDNLS